MLGRSYDLLAELLGRAKKFEEAEIAAERSVHIYIRLTDDFPTMPDFAEALAGCHRRLGDLYRRRGRLPEAEAEFHQASRIEESLRGGSGVTR
jgi:hypothetical protein